MVLVVPLLGGMHMVLHSPQLGNSCNTRLTQLEFLSSLVLVCVICTSVSLVQLHARRLHFAQLGTLVEQLGKQRDRLHYQVRFAKKHAEGAPSDGGRMYHTVGQMGDGGSTYGSNSELADIAPPSHPSLAPVLAARPLTQSREAPQSLRRRGTNADNCDAAITNAAPLFAPLATDGAMRISSPSLCSARSARSPIVSRRLQRAAEHALP